MDEKKTTHTLGPWNTDGGTHITTQEEHPRSTYPDKKAKIAEVIPANYKFDSISGRTIGGTWDAETEANAQLIAAAPELLDACKRALEILNTIENIPVSDGVNMCRQAIAKATGE